MGFIKKLLGGIFSFLGGLLRIVGLGKKSEYFLEAEPTEGTAAPAVAPTNGKVAEPIATVAAAQPVATAPTPAPTPAPAPAPEPVGTFATDYLLTNGGGRRRPGPSLSSYMDMAKQVKS